MENNQEIFKYIMNHEDEDYNLKKMADDIGMLHSTLSVNLKKLRDNDLVVRTKTNYSLTSTGKLFSQAILNYYNSKKVIEEFSDFWQNHIVSDIPKESIDTIFALKDSYLLYAKNYDIYLPENYLLDNMEDSAYLYAIITEVNESYIDLISNLVMNDISVTVIIPNKIVRRFVYFLDDDVIENDNLHLFSSEKDIKLNLFLNDFMFCLNLFRQDNYIDKHILLVSDDTGGVKWAKSLYFHVFDREKVNVYNL